MGMLNLNTPKLTIGISYAYMSNTGMRVNTVSIRGTSSLQEKTVRDSGSPEFQIERLSIRIEQLSKHLQVHTHDNATKRGLIVIIGKRLGLLRYLEKKDYRRYCQICSSLGIKKLKKGIR